MKLLKLVFMLLMLICIGCTNNPSVNITTPQATIESLFNAIKQNDTLAFKTLLATMDDYKSFVHISKMDGHDDTARVATYARENSDKNNVERFMRQFSTIRIDGMANGITDWKEVNFVRALYDTRGQVGDEPAQVFYPKAEFKYGDYVGAINVGYRLIKTERGWILASFQFMQFNTMGRMPT